MYITSSWNSISSVAVNLHFWGFLFLIPTIIGLEIHLIPFQQCLLNTHQNYMHSEWAQLTMSHSAHSICNIQTFPTIELSKIRHAESIPETRITLYTNFTSIFFKGRK